MRHALSLLRHIVPHQNKEKGLCMLGDAIGNAIRVVFITAFLKPLYLWLQDEISLWEMIKRLVFVCVCWAFCLLALVALLMLMLYSAEY
jgi:hypothetical protein